jgi:apolipoprotein N-acyltransferase
MAYPGIFLSYLERFDKNRSSKVYGLTFIISYTICSFVWFGVSIVVPFALPYTIFAYPLALVLLTLFANRRGELSYLWHGSFYDEQRQQFET